MYVLLLLADAGGLLLPPAYLLRLRPAKVVDNMVMMGGLQQHGCSCA